MTQEPEPRVIVGVDGSDGSLQALRVAVDQARRRDLPLAIVHVIGWVGIEEGWLQARRRGHDLVDKCIKDGLGVSPADLEVKNVVVERVAPGPGLVFLADPDCLIVVGTRLTKRVWRPGVDTYPVRNAPCPVLTVPPPQMLRLIRTSRRERKDWRRGVEQLAAAAAGE
jgi:nucleotide-binding universal stress UspA family protein